MTVSRRKTEYMCVNERQDNGSGTVKMKGEEVAKVEDFKYLGSTVTVQSNGECGREAKKRVQAGWNGWRRISGVICDRMVGQSERWLDKVKDDIKEKGLSADDVYDRATWRRMSSYIDPT